MALPPVYFPTLGWDVLGALRAGAEGAELENFLARIWHGRLDRYSDERAELLAKGADVRTLAIWVGVGVFLMIRFLRQPLGER